MNRKYNDAQIIELHSEGLTDKEIAEILGVKPTTFACKRGKLGLKPNKGKKETYELSNIELEILIGTLLGDSSVRYVYSGCKYPNLTFSHCPEQQEYFDWKTNKLKNLLSSTGNYENNYLKLDGNYNRRLRFTGSNMKCLVEIRNQFYPEGTKVIPIEFIKDKFSELSLYCMYMDDGSYDKTRNSYIINTQCFSKENLEEFTKLMLDKFGLKFTIKSDNSLYLRHESNEKFQKILLNYNECETMRYKCGMSSLNSVKRGNSQEDNPVLNPQEIEENA